ncbi:MAG: DNA polymerase III subunit gamma/tau [Ruminococcaceae bacterium]|nr:DNA polymerase III subunit gamma/tau [Oscillospiraceae bacterium]
MTLYRKWRPLDFASVVGQNPVTDVLRYQVDQKKTTHAYLFCGSRGTGKTTCAKILAKAINCLSPVNGNPCGTCDACRHIDSGSATDIVEMDAASNNGVDYIRDIREEVVYAPAFLQKRVYIIDEVHMLSSGAFNALLKTLEEPPPHIVFILATTELQKLPATITSRCQRFDFRRISTNDIAERLEYIAAKENIIVTHEAAQLIGRLSQGGMRDAISLLELCSGTGKTIDTELVNRTAGVTGRQTVTRMVTAILRKDITDLFTVIAEFTAASTDLAVFWQELIGYYRDMLVVRSVKRADGFLDLTAEELSQTIDLAARFSRERLLYHIRLMEDAYITMQRGGSLKRVTAEMTLVRMTDDRLSDSTEALLSRMAALEERMASSTVVSSPITSLPDTALNSDQPTATTSATPLKIDSDQSEALRPLPSWPDIVKTVERTDNGAASHLRLARGYQAGQTIVVRVSDHFSKMLIDSDAVRLALATAINLSGDAEGIQPQNIQIRMEKFEEETDDPLASLASPE